VSREEDGLVIGHALLPPTAAALKDRGGVTDRHVAGECLSRTYEIFAIAKALAVPNFPNATGSMHYARIRLSSAHS
jgi:hypothetical protein